MLRLLGRGRLLCATSHNNVLLNGSTIHAALIHMRTQRITTLAPGHGRTRRSPESSDTADSVSVARPKRPTSPHLTIYRPQLTWLMSIAHRMTGAGLASGVYAGGIAASVGLSGPLTATLASLVASAPLGLVLAGKFIVAAPFCFHTFNGVRHLVWDLGWALTLRGVYVTGWAVNIGTLLAATALTLL